MVGLATALAAVEEAMSALKDVDVHGEPAEVLTAAMAILERIDAKVSAVRARVVAQVEADGVWSLGGSRSMQGWVRTSTGRFATEASSLVRASRGLRDHLPGAAEALAQGEITMDHVQALVRHALGSEACRDRLGDEDVGEAFLLEQARKVDATAFNRLVKTWAMYADPEAADAAWRDDAGREMFSFGRTMDGWSGRLWLSEANGALLDEALRALTGVAPIGDTRTPAERRAGALVEAAGHVLDSGAALPGARIRPHVGITADLATLKAVIDAQGARSADEAPTESTTDEASIDEAPDVGDELLARIDVGLDYEALAGTEPAQLADGTPVPFGLFAQLLCEAGLYRVIFGADSELLDVGREKRLFTAAQTRGILARDGGCRFPSCTAPAGIGEIHHALHFAAHGGETKVSNGVLLCRYHHSLVHRLELVIEHRESGWRFLRPDGRTYGITPSSPSRQLALV